MNILTNDQIHRVAPSVFATQPDHEVSDKYQFIPTIQVVDEMRRHGWEPVKAMQTRARDAEKRDVAKHMLRFRHKDHGLANMRHVGDILPEIILTNSHDRSAAYGIHAGLFRLVCSNGMTVADSTFGKIAVRHSGDVLQDVIEGTYSVIEDTPKVLERVGEMREIELNPEEKQIMAQAAIDVRWGDEGHQPIQPDQLLRPRRWDDKSNDLWTTFNVVQENMIKGGLYGVGSTGRRQRTRAVKSVNQDIKLNKALWTLAEKMAELKAA